MENNAFFALALGFVRGLSHKKVNRLIKDFVQLEDIFLLSPTSLKELGLSDQNISQIKSGVALELARKEYQLSQIHNFQILYFEDYNYPKLLKEIHDFPPIIFFQGNPLALKQNYISVVGSRSISHDGKRAIRKFLPLWVEAQLGICSGFARGVDIHAHQSCIERRGWTLAIQACGLGFKYPKSHHHYESSLMERGGFISEMPFHTKAHPGLFPRRNRIITGISQGLVVIEARKKSGALISARYALEQNRDVFVIPHSLFNVSGEGGNQLIQDGAHVLLEPEDLLNFYQINIVSQKKDNETTHKPCAISDQIFELCKEEALTINELVSRLGQSPSHINQYLSYLELDNRIELLGGGRYQSIW